MHLDFFGVFGVTLFWETELKVTLSWMPMDAIKQVPLVLLTK